MGLLEKARDTVQKLRALTIEAMPSTEHWRKAEFREFFSRGIAFGGWREDVNRPSAGAASDSCALTRVGPV